MKVLEKARARERPLSPSPPQKPLFANKYYSSIGTSVNAK